MKICAMTYSLFSHGGVQRVISTLFNELSKEHEIDILYLGNLEYCKEKLYGLDESKIKIIINRLNYSSSQVVIRRVTNAINKFTQLFNNEKAVLKYGALTYPNSVKEEIINIINDNNYDLVIGVAGEINLLLGSIADKINAKTIGWQHNSYDAYYNTPNKYLWKKQVFSQKMLEKLDEVVVLTEDDKKKYYKFMGIKSHRIYNPLSFNSELKSNCFSKNIVSVGRLTKQKGFDLLIEAFKEVNKINSEWTLTIVGDGEEKKALRTLIEKYKLGNNIFIKPFTDNIIEQYLNSSVYVSSSRWEGFGLVLIEAMECGLPVIAFDNSGPREIIDRDGVNGILVESGNINKLSCEIIELINNEEKRMSISKESINRAKCFYTEEIAREWSKILCNN